MPSTITSSTTATLIAVMTALTRDDSFVPTTSSTVSTATSSTAPQSNLKLPNATSVLASMPISPSVVCR